MHVIAGKAVAFKVAATRNSKTACNAPLDGKDRLPERLMADDVKTTASAS